MNSREIELKKLGFELNNDQRCFYRWKYNSLYIFDFYDVENLSDVRWSIRIEDYKKYLQKSKEELENLPLVSFDKIVKSKTNYILVNGEYVKETESKKLR